MVNAWWFCLPVGCVLGFLSGLGVGGGSLLMLWLTLAAGTDQSHARIMNLMFFVPCALMATVLRWRQGKPDLPLVLTAAAAGLLGAVGGNLLLTRLDPEPLRKALGLLFLACGAKELFYRPRELR